MSKFNTKRDMLNEFLLLPIIIYVFLIFKKKYIIYKLSNPFLDILQ